MTYTPFCCWGKYCFLLQVSHKLSSYFSLTNLPICVILCTCTEAASASSVYVTGQTPYYHGSSQPHGSSSQYQATSQAVAYLPPAAPTHTNPPAPSQPPQPPTREDKHLQPVYMQSGRGKCSLLTGVSCHTSYIIMMISYDNIIISVFLKASTINLF